MWTRGCAALALATSLLGSGAATAGGMALPDHMTLHYLLHYGDVVVAKSVQTLRRNPSGAYYHSAWTRPAGIAKVFTQVQFLEQGEFRIQGTEVLPVRFSDSRIGDSRHYKRQVVFDYEHQQLRFSGHPVKPLSRGTQDLDSIFYAFMLRPATPGMHREVLITNGKDVDRYWFVYRRSQVLTTALGRVSTYLISRLSHSEWIEEQHCGKAGSQACLRPLRVFEIWVAPKLRDVVVKARERKHGHTLTLSLERLTQGVHE